MTAPSTSTAFARAGQPWSEKFLAPRWKTLVGFACVLLVILIIVFGFVLISMIGVLRASAPVGGSSHGSLPGTVLVGLLLGGCLFGLVKIFPYATNPANFKPRGEVVPTTALGAAYSVKFKRSTRRRALVGSGSVRFAEDTLVIEGDLHTSEYVQLGIVLLITIIPLVLFGIGAGIILALIIARSIGQKKLSREIAYQQISDIEVRGCRVSARCGGEPEAIRFYVSALDGERLYRELRTHFPTAVTHWQGE